MAADLQSKYTKLAQEYSKLRAQNQVLKKAVVDEQGSSASLKEQLKQREQSLRKVEQEMDSLSFRNQQLAKRVELLQEELAAGEVRGKRGKQKAGDSPSQQGLQHQTVFDEDLQKKIEENERLHIQFFEADEQHRRQEAQLKERLEVLERDAGQHQAVVDGLTHKYMETIERLQNDRAKLEVKSQTLEREAKDCRLRTDECQQQLKRFQAELSQQLEESVSIIQEKVPFNDTKHSQFNTLNVPPHNRRHQLKARDVAGQALGLVQDLVPALLNLHTYSEQRAHIYPRDSALEPVSPLNQRFSQHLHENAAYVRPLEDGLLRLFESITEHTVTTLETTVKLKDFSDHFTSYTRFLQKILPYQLKSLDEECESPLCTSALTAKNRELQADMRRMTAAFEKLQTYISLLALPSTRPEALPRSSCSAVFTQLAACLHGLQDSVKDVSKHYSQKATLEQELPTVTQKLRTTNECILSSLGSLTNSTGKIATFFSNNLDFFTAPAGYRPRGGRAGIDPLQAEAMLQNKSRAAAYILALRKPQPETVPYSQALSNRRVLTSSTESREGLTQQVQQSQEKIARLEQEKEHWLLEAQLGRIRLEKESQRIAELEGQLSAALTGQPPPTAAQDAPAPPGQDGEEPPELGLKETTSAASLIGLLSTTPTSEEAGDEQSREQLIKTHYMARVADLTAQLQVADSKAVHFHAECRALAKRLALAEKSRETLTEELKAAAQNISRLQDELTTTKRSYEDQLSMMSDHLCSMNETLSRQREEIDTLKMGSKGNAKKNKSR